jgi:TFIIF-interacting CTD phosphatase-like protein
MALQSVKNEEIQDFYVLQCDNTRCKSNSKRVTTERYISAFMVAGLKSRRGSIRAQ